MYKSKIRVERQSEIREIIEQREKKYLYRTKIKIKKLVIIIGIRNVLKLEYKFYDEYIE